MCEQCSKRDVCANIDAYNEIAEYVNELAVAVSLVAEIGVSCPSYAKAKTPPEEGLLCQQETL